MPKRFQFTTYIKFNTLSQCSAIRVHMFLCTPVNGQVETPPVQVAGNDHHECKLCFCVSC